LHFPDQWDPRSLDILGKRCQLLARSARAIIVHNDYTKGDVCERLNIDSARVVVARLPSILPQLEVGALPPVDKTLHQLGIRQPYALWASSSTFSHKNHDRLLRAWRILRDRGRDIQLVCTGSKEPRWAAVDRLVGQLGLRDRVVFTGGVPREVLRVVLANATIAVCPTLFEGGGSGPVAEAIMARLPVACARIPQIQEQLDFRDDLAEWFDPLDDRAIADAVAKLLDNESAALDRARYAAEVYPTLRSWSRVASVYWETLDAAALNPR
jgi:glycosyltransferase involved in cell wall biosynthesis